MKKVKKSIKPPEYKYSVDLFHRNKFPLVIFALKLRSALPQDVIRIIVKLLDSLTLRFCPLDDKMRNGDYSKFEVAENGFSVKMIQSVSSNSSFARLVVPLSTSFHGNDDFQFKVKFIKVTQWAGIGMAEKENIFNTKLEYSALGNGYYVCSQDGRFFNSDNPNPTLSSFSTQHQCQIRWSPGQIVHFVYIGENKELTLTTYENQSLDKLTSDVISFPKINPTTIFVPVVLTYDADDSVEIIH